MPRLPDCSSHAKKPYCPSAFTSFRGFTKPSHPRCPSVFQSQSYKRASNRENSGGQVWDNAGSGSFTPKSLSRFTGPIHGYFHPASPHLHLAPEYGCPKLRGTGKKTDRLTSWKRGKGAIHGDRLRLRQDPLRQLQRRLSPSPARHGDFFQHPLPASTLVPQAGMSECARARTE